MGLSSYFDHYIRGIDIPCSPYVANLPVVETRFLVVNNETMNLYRRFATI